MIYSQTQTRPYLVFFVAFLLRFIHLLSLTHFGVGKRVLRYLKGMVNLGIWYYKEMKVLKVMLTVIELILLIFK